ncbi:hypothetical protein FSP39_000312 [Pinctada imbricata]|uniref:Uncharacterized protein n=1 Tax=Pinctada imbricata TaxID=66713 RepID=A0AA89BY47_PINIB|nr:hypothetical protein FSP39_000312 [Pinctada imbricata]
MSILDGFYLTFITSSPYNLPHYIYLGSPATSVKGTSDKLLIDWDSVFQSQEQGKLVYVFAVGSRKGYVDIQRPIETMGTNMTVSLEGDTKEIFLSIHAFAPNLEASHYYAMIHT